MTENDKRTKAWVGDAVLCLFAREWILRDSAIHEKDRNEIFIRMTSNKFLSSVGEPTAMEAQIGRIYESEDSKQPSNISRKALFRLWKQQLRPQQPKLRSKKKKK